MTPGTPAPAARRMVRAIAGSWMWALSTTHALAAQAPATPAEQAGNVPDVAKAMVVSVTSSFSDGTAGSYGAGIIVGTDGNSLYIATAGHVVQGGPGAPMVWVAFAAGDSARATVVLPRGPELDLAVLQVTVDPAHRERWIPGSWDRVGNVRALRSDDPVSPVGCPQQVCWEAPAPADRVVGKDPLGILFQSYFVGPGSSGGALFNQYWEVVGMVTHDDPPRGEALRIDEVLDRVRASKLPVSLQRPSVPRGGYPTSIGVAVLTSSSSSSPGASDSRAPSGRVTLERRVMPAVSWHVSALRLAPDNLAITAAMGGVGLHLTVGRFSAAPFVEAGFGHVEGRHDLGGHYVAGSGGSQYVPLWNREVGDGLGIGGGATLEAIAFPRTIVEITAGYWSFTTPENVPKLKKVFFGGGLRLGL
jgi:S1-C subfamily serine protease